jgi:hypothetical protein
VAFEYIEEDLAYPRYSGLSALAALGKAKTARTATRAESLPLG